MRPLVLSLFPGIGLLDMAFEEEGFCIVRGPDLLWGGDIKRFRPPSGRFDGVIGGPPCQAFSVLQNIVEANRKKNPGKYVKAENLIPEFERVVSEAKPRWFLMENVPQAPSPAIAGYSVHTMRLNNRWVGGVQNRLRAISFGNTLGRKLAIQIEAFEPFEYRDAVLASGGHYGPAVRLGGSGKPRRHGRGLGSGKRQSIGYLSEAISSQGLPSNFLEDAPFTVAGKIKVIGNGVPLPMGRALARAVRDVLGIERAA